MQHWKITREADGLARLTFDKAGATTNTLSAAVLIELNAALDDSLFLKRVDSGGPSKPARRRPSRPTRDRR